MTTPAPYLIYQVYDGSWLIGKLALSAEAAERMRKAGFTLKAL